MPPCLNIEYERSTGRHFIYDNNGVVLVFSKKPIQQSVTNDKSRPLAEMYLQDLQTRRIDPTLKIIESNSSKIHILLVAGGYSISETGQILRFTSIKVFKIDQQKVSSQYIFMLQMGTGRVNPIIYEYIDLAQCKHLLLVFGGLQLDNVKNQPIKVGKDYKTALESYMDLCDGIQVPDIIEGVIREGQPSLHGTETKKMKMCLEITLDYQLSEISQQQLQKILAGGSICVVQ